MEEYEKVKNWLAASGLCILDKVDPNVGAVHSYYDTKDHKYSFLYPEITGYYLSTLKFVSSKEKSEKYIEIAKLCGTWLMSVHEKYGGIVMGIGLESRMIDQIFSFDTSICAKGFLDLYEITSDNKYKEFAKKLIDWLATECVEQDGTVRPVMDRKSGKFVETSMWYAQKGCFGIKLVMPLLQLDDPKLREIAVKIANTYKKFQNPNGSFALHLGSKSVNLHSHSYALEGLIYAYAVLKDPAYLESCRKGLDWVVSQINEDGSVYLWTDYNYKSKAAYPIAQLIRLMVLTDSVGSALKYLKPAKQLTDFLLTLQAKEEDAKMNGGFYEEFHKSIMGWKKQHRINSWTSMFALQALDWIEYHDKMSFEKSIEYLY
ncbi:MAG: hypothetical protein AUI92_07155 [Thaumarchaeota archaeon 13_1_40CM_3_38_6]|nr:MAG: hypothetical protein AUI92_07155 [Thaumarchaeota archaeon 13_1_40CM_3_38_6]